MNRIFVSWSGDRSRTVALGLKSLVQDVFGDSVDVFISAHMDPGVVWVQQLGKELEGSDFGILCLTEDNIQSPWLLFEAGAIAKNFGAARVVPYLLDDTALMSPLNQFQHVRANYEGTLRLVESIDALREKSLPADRLRRAFDRWWPDLKQTIEDLPEVARAKKQSDRALLENIWNAVHTLLDADSRSSARVLALPPAATAHLLNLRDRPETLYSRNEALKKELRMLRDLGLIRNRIPIDKLPEKFRLNEYFELEGPGRRYAESVSSAGS
jgi:hypothetical protein